MDKLFAELKRRNVIRVAGVYAVVGWVSAQIATTLEEALGLPGWFDGVIVAILLLGLPIALVLAWAFELTPDGVLRTEDVPEGASIANDTGRKLDYAIVLGLVLLGVMMIWQQMTMPESPSSEVEPALALSAEPTGTDASIAVLPFADLSPQGDQEYFSDGISEEILNVLVAVDGLQVASRTSSFQFKSRELGIPEIAEQLKVRHVLEGSVRKSGETIRITAQLIDAVSDKHLWSETFDRPLTAENVFLIQDEIASAIVTALREALGISISVPAEIGADTGNLGAYELFLEARPLFNTRTRLDEADELLRRAVEQDPEFARAWELRAALQTLIVDYGYSTEPYLEATERSDEFANAALQINPKSAMALAVKGKNLAAYTYRMNREIPVGSAIEMFDRALEIDPRNPSALNWRGLRYLLYGYVEKARLDFVECVRYEPFYGPCVENVYAVLSVQGRDEEAVDTYTKALNTSSIKVMFAPFTSLARLDLELPFKMVTNLDTWLLGWRQHDELYQAYLRPDADHTVLIESIAEFYEQKPGGSTDDFLILVQPIGYEPESPERLTLWDPAVKQYRQSEKFKAYMRSVGAEGYWREFGFPPQCRAVGDDDFECM